MLVSRLCSLLDWCCTFKASCTRHGPHEQSYRPTSKGLGPVEVAVRCCGAASLFQHCTLPCRGCLRLPAERTLDIWRGLSLSRQNCSQRSHRRRSPLKRRQARSKMKWQRCTMAESARDFLPCRPRASLRCRRSSSSFCSYWTYLQRCTDSFARCLAESVVTCCCKLRRRQALEVAPNVGHECNELLPHM